MYFHLLNKIPVTYFLWRKCYLETINRIRPCTICGYNHWMKSCVDNFIRCEKLDLTKHINSLVNQTGSWEKTYWQIWSECHFLTCITCKFQYPVKNSAMCQYHPESPEYFPIGNLGLEQPIGITNNVFL